ncbi:hypothetical protein FQR65_LT16167 [Abscondita terminalis]|nr:hypothetical protein FQR65_LT16167 [Abscondita terminalis]
MNSYATLICVSILTFHITATTQATCGGVECGNNTQCLGILGNSICTCLLGYVKDSQNNCVRIECLLNSDCASDRACRNGLCVDPCADLCVTNSICTVANHVPVCTCRHGYTGNPFANCIPI